MNLRGMRVFIGPPMGRDAFPIGQTQEGAPVIADVDGVSELREITGAFTQPACGCPWPCLPAEVACDRTPKHTGKHRNLEHRMDLWDVA